MTHFFPGLLEYARKHNSAAIQVEESWFEKVNDWEQAFSLYTQKLKRDPDNFDLALGKMRCLEALGEWGQLYDTTRRWWDINTPNVSEVDRESCRGKISRLAAASAWAADQWPMMEKALVYVPPDTHNGAFYRAVLAVHQGNYEKAHQVHWIKAC